jgi:glyoxylase-like metal-dependent hydrolase (beta-lactamase superfamily II)
MLTQAWIRLAVFVALSAGVALAQDAASTLQRAQKAMGEVQSIQYSATGTMGGFGQSWHPGGPWHPTVITSYTRTIDYGSGSSQEELTRRQENPPARGGEAPFAGEQKQVNLVSGKYAWNQPGGAPQPALAAADERQLQIWLTPHGFLKAAGKDHATAKAGKEAGKKVTVVTFMSGRNKVVGDIDNSNNMVTKVETWIANPVLGDMPVEIRYSDYKDFGGVKFPAHIVQQQGGQTILDLNVTGVQTNVPNAGLQIPDAVQQATLPPVRVTSQKLADGVWFLAGGTHNSVLVEFQNYVAVVEAPLNEARSLAVIAEVKKLVPDKPIRYLINTHQHFDHSGGIRTYVAEGATVITQAADKTFYEQAWKQPRTLDPDRLAQNPKKAAFITYQRQYVLSDGTRSIELHHIEADNHNEFMSFAYLPQEKILIEADDYTPGAPPPPMAVAFANNLNDNLQRLKIDVVTIAPLHGNVATMADLQRALGK